MKSEANENVQTNSAPALNLSLEQLVTLVKEVANANTDPDVLEERARQAAEKGAKKVQREQEAARIRAEMAQKEHVKRTCRHKRKDRSWALAGQRNSKGDYMIICQQCTSTFLPGDKDYDRLLSEVIEEGIISNFGNARQVG